MSTCRSTAYLAVNNEPLTTAPLLRCEHHEGHAGPHFVAFAWADDDAIDWPEALDPDEGFDVEVDIDPEAAALLDLQERYGDGPSIAPPRLDRILDAARDSINGA